MAQKRRAFAPPEIHPADTGLVARQRVTKPLKMAAGGALLLVVGSYGLWQLVHAAMTGEIHTSHGSFRLDSEALSFWFYVVLEGLATFVTLGLTGLLTITWLRRREGEARIDAYLQRRADDGGQASAIRPRLR